MKSKVPFVTFCFSFAFALNKSKAKESQNKRLALQASSFGRKAEERKKNIE